MIKILVTGGAGFIGSEFVNMYAEKYDIHVIDKLTYAGNLENILTGNFNRKQFYKVDICDYARCEKIFKLIRPDIVINFAAESHVDNSIQSSSEFISTNITGAHNLLELSRKYNVIKYIQISTDEVYGHLEANDPAFTENTPLDPRSPYSATKASADLIIMSYVNTHKINACITRCSNNYGRNQHKEKFIPTVVSNAIADKNIPVYGTGTNIRDWIHVDDHVRGIHAVMLKGVAGQIYNFGGNNQINNLELCKKILDILNKPQSLIEFVEDRKGHDFRYAIDYSKSKQELSWEPLADFEIELEKTVNILKTKFSKP
jgi:dTDP-glucose 4,6-dehydratase